MKLQQWAPCVHTTQRWWPMRRNARTTDFQGPCITLAQEEAIAKELTSWGRCLLHRMRQRVAINFSIRLVPRTTSAKLSAIQLPATPSRTTQRESGIFL